LRLGTARARVKGHDGVQPVVLAAQQGGRLQLVERLPEGIQFGAEFLPHALTLVGKFKVGFQVRQTARQLVVGLERFF
jgi:hypothetical protein